LPQLKANSPPTLIPALAFAVLQPAAEESARFTSSASESAPLPFRAVHASQLLHSSSLALQLRYATSAFQLIPPFSSPQKSFSAHHRIGTSPRHHPKRHHRRSAPLCFTSQRSWLEELFFISCSTVKQPAENQKKPPAAKIHVRSYVLTLNTRNGSSSSGHAVCRNSKQTARPFSSQPLRIRF